MYEHSLYLQQVEDDDHDHVERMLSKLDEHCLKGSPLGDFLSAIIVGDLNGAAGHADGINKKYLALYSMYCYNQLPADKQSIAQPIMRLLYKLKGKYGWMTRGQVARAIDAFREALVEILQKEPAKDR